ncbi:hypothetical protein LguiA_001001 [Lonicera macranthoides]
MGQEHKRYGFSSSATVPPLSLGRLRVDSTHVPVPGSNSSSMSFESEDEWNTAQQSQLCGAHIRGAFGNTDFVSSELGFSQYNTTEEQLQLSEEQLQLFSSIGSLDDIFDVVTPFHEDIQSEISKLIEPQKKEKEFSFPFASLRILKNFRTKFRQLNGGNRNLSTYDTSLPKASGQNLSTIEIVRLAGEKFVKSFSQGIDDHSDLIHPFGSSLLGLSDEKTRDVELIQDLLAFAEKVGQQQFDRASKLLDHCAEVSSKN